MSHELHILIQAVRAVASAVWKKRFFALGGFVANWVIQRFAPTGWLGAVLNGVFHWLEHKASTLGWLLLGVLVLVAILLVAEVRAERRGAGFNRGWVVDATSWAASWYLIPSIAGASAMVFGVSAGFGVDGALFGAAFLIWMGLILSGLQALVGFAGMRCQR